MENGYYLAKNIFDHDKIAIIRNEMETIFENFSSDAICGCADPFLMELFKIDFEAFIGCAQLCQKLCSVYSLAGSLFRPLMDHCEMDFPVLNTKPLVSFSSKHTAKSEAYWKVGPHQDWPSNLGSRNGVTCWIPLQDVDRDLGQLEVVPDSHLFGPLEHKGTPPIIHGRPAEKYFNYVPVPMEVGDALFFHTMLVHRSGENITEDRIRWSMHFRYNDASERSFIKRKYPKNRTGD